MVVLTASALDAPEGRVLPVSLPVWGRYEGSGVVLDIDEGPNVTRILSGWQSDLVGASAFVDWEALGMEAMEIDHIETLIAVVIANEYHGLNALTWRGARLSLCLFESNIAACLMQGEPESLHKIKVEDLASCVLSNHPIANSIYSELADEGPKLRCKFGLGSVALSSLVEAMNSSNKVWARPKQGITELERDPARWLAEAYLAFADEPDLIEALEEYTTQQGGSADDEIDIDEDLNASDAQGLP